MTVFNEHQVIFNYSEKMSTKNSCTTVVRVPKLKCDIAVVFLQLHSDDKLLLLLLLLMICWPVVCAEQIKIILRFFSFSSSLSHPQPTRCNLKAKLRLPHQLMRLNFQTNDDCIIYSDQEIQLNVIEFKPIRVDMKVACWNITNCIIF